MKVVIERARCAGHARCAAVAADIFLLGDDGYIDSDGFDVPPGSEALARRGARACPERIISLVEEPEAPAAPGQTRSPE